MPKKLGKDSFLHARKSARVKQLLKSKFMSNIDFFRLGQFNKHMYHLFTDAKCLYFQSQATGQVQAFR